MTSGKERPLCATSCPFKMTFMRSRLQIVKFNAADFEPDTFEHRDETALADLISQKPTAAVVRPYGEPRDRTNVVDMDTALKRGSQGSRGGYAGQPARRGKQRPT